MRILATGQSGGDTSQIIYLSPFSVYWSGMKAWRSKKAVEP
jgi:hypothetical protein